MKIPTTTVFALGLVLTTAALVAVQVRGGNGTAATPGSRGSNLGVPSPTAGAGLPFLLLAGGYVLVRRYRNRGKPD